MKIFNVFLPGLWRDHTRMKRNNKGKSVTDDDLPISDHFSILSPVKTGDSYFLNA
jgi:hypothetical protein